MKKTVNLVFYVCIILFLFFIEKEPGREEYAIVKNNIGMVSQTDWDKIITETVNESHIGLMVDGKEVTEANMFMYRNRDIMIEISHLSEILDCSAHVYNNTKLKLEKCQKEIEYVLNSHTYYINGKETEGNSPMLKVEGKFYVPLKNIANGLSYSYEWKGDTHTVLLVNESVDRTIPYSYDLRKVGRAPQVKNQGNYGNCWAFASLAGVESSLLPEEKLSLSADHMNRCNSFSVEPDSGGEYAMAVAYLSSWQGPVLEEDDQYGDGESPEGLSAVRHVQEVRFIESKSLDRIKQMVYKYGAVETSFYSALETAESTSKYYNEDTYSYCYIGEEKPNHDVVIIGWDDTFPKENFNVELEGDGAFLCQNSWGEEFGDKGVFYVSYYDSNIGIYNIAYTKVESADNYDNIYQSDLCGWVGQLGYRDESAFFANVYTAEEKEQIAAVSFYALGKSTEYEIYYVNDYQDVNDFNRKVMVKRGHMEDAGYYTVEIPYGREVEAGEKFAIVVKITTPNAIHPVAVEYAAGAATEDVILSDGEGYISHEGTTWDSVEKKQNCNVCLKVFTKRSVD